MSKSSDGVNARHIAAMLPRTYTPMQLDGSSLTIALIAVFLFLVSVPCRSQDSPALTRLQYNNPGLVTDLGVGLWAWPLPMDFDHDGDLDLVVNCPDKPYNGVYFFENPSESGKVTPAPIFRKARRISRGLQNTQVSYVDGKPVVMTPGMIYPDFLHSGLEQPVALPLPANIHPNKVRANMWRSVDYDGNGLQDLIIGVGDWTDYGWDNAWNSQGEWTNGPLRGFVYLARNTGTDDKPNYESPIKVLA
ncbi:MAG: hypothetical protein ACK50J_20035, partial [Planctomyces sp.]